MLSFVGPFVVFMTVFALVKLIEILAETKGFDNTCGIELWVDDFPVDKVSRLNGLPQDDILLLVSPWLLELGMGKNERPLVLAVLAFLSLSVLLFIALTTGPGVVVVEVGNTLDSANYG